RFGYLFICICWLIACKKDVTPDSGSEVQPIDIQKNGVTIDYDKREVSFVLSAPGKSSVFLLGDFNNYQPSSAYEMKPTPEGDVWWITLNDLDFQKDYTYQFLVDDQLRIADPYTTLVLDPDHDAWVPSLMELPKYPEGSTTGIVSVLQLNPATYTWKSG